MTESEAIEWIKELRDSEEIREFYYVENFIRACDMAIQTLEKQVPKKPMMVYDDKVDSNWCSCPICANGIGWGIPARKIKFCWDCGQRLDFGDDEK